MSTPTKPTRQELYEAAADYLARGWSCIPLTHDKKAACAWKRWQRERPDNGQLRRWFLEGRDVKGEVVGVGIIGGAVSGGLAVRDFDTQESYFAWARGHPDLLGTLPTVTTARGYHVYAIAPLATRTRTQGDGEMRGEGAYVAAPPTLHPTGKRYEWHLPPDGPLPVVSDLAAAGLVFGDTLPLTANPDEQSGKVGEKGETKVSPQSLEALVSLVTLAPLVMQDNPTLGMQDTIPPQNSRIETAIQTTLPRAPGQRHKRLFIFAGKCRAIGGPDAKAGDFKADVRRWHTLALPIIGTKEWAETWADFCESFEDVKRPREGSDLSAMMCNADAETLPACAADYADAPALCRLVKLCRALQRAAGAGVAFYLCQRAAGAALGMDQATISRYLAAMQADGILRRTYKGHTGKASEYIFTDDS